MPMTDTAQPAASFFAADAIQPRPNGAAGEPRLDGGATQPRLNGAAPPHAGSETPAPRFTSEAAGLAAMADALVAHGKLSRESAAQMLDAELAAYRGEPSAVPALDAAAPTSFGASASSAQTEAGGEPSSTSALSTASTDNEAGSDASFDDASFDDPDPLFAPPETPEGYTLTLNPAVKMGVADIAEVRQWFHAMRLPAPIAQSLYSEVERMSMAPPDAAAITRMNTTTMSELTRAWGERTDTMLGHARRLIDTAAHKHPGLKTALARGPGSNPLVVRQLAEHAARLYGRPATPRQSAEGEH